MLMFFLEKLCICGEQKCFVSLTLDFYNTTYITYQSKFVTSQAYEKQRLLHRFLISSGQDERARSDVKSRP